MREDKEENENLNLYFNDVYLHIINFNIFSLLTDMVPGLENIVLFSTIYILSYKNDFEQKVHAKSN